MYVASMVEVWMPLFSVSGLGERDRLIGVLTRQLKQGKSTFEAPLPNGEFVALPMMPFSGTVPST